MTNETYCNVRTCLAQTARTSFSNTAKKCDADSLEDEITDRDFRIKQLHDELEEQKARTIADLIAELTVEIRTQQHIANDAKTELRKAYKEAEDAKEKLKMWNHLRTP